MPASFFFLSDADAEEMPSFLGTGWSFPPQFATRNRLLGMTSDEEDIRQSLYLLFHTEPGDRVMNPDYGCPLRQFLFENMDRSSLTHITDVVSKAVLTYEPRISLHEVKVNTDSINDGVIFLEVNYAVRTINSRHNVVYPFYLTEATLLPGK
ncbi:GPW/gp25 family protein [Hymenobacter sp. BT175]|uniref:GPW/gp25 family protein n=1 Tax=Hymenobacter translucens TaxID=2886507 RepID=UPI001D0F22E1|nr:GPW/gp25 family protein [Hymenobacter translucens]MCC2545348.1 GPW/gp25 family protein [Hymenobacter translucens]